MSAGYAITALVLAAALLIAMVFCICTAYANGRREGRREAIELCLREQDAHVQMFVSRLTSLVTSACDDGQEAIRARKILNCISTLEQAISAVSDPIRLEVHELSRILATCDQEQLSECARGELRGALLSMNTDWARKRSAIEHNLRIVIAPSSPEPRN